VIRWFALAVAVLILSGCGYISGVGLNYDPNTGAIGGSVSFPTGKAAKKLPNYSKDK